MKLYDDLLVVGDIELDSIPASLQAVTHWQYGTGQHASASQKTSKCLPLSPITDTGNAPAIRHLVVEGSSEWVTGRNVTARSDILHVSRNAIQICTNGLDDLVPMVYSGSLSYIPLKNFRLTNENPKPLLFCLHDSILHEKSRKEVKTIIDRVHKQVCGPGRLPDFGTLLEQNNQ